MSKFLDEFGLAHVWTNIKNYIDGKVSSESGGGAEDVYSMEETRIGTWFDKPLYRKCFELNYVNMEDNGFYVIPNTVDFSQNITLVNYDGKIQNDYIKTKADGTVITYGRVFSCRIVTNITYGVAVVFSSVNVSSQTLPSDIYDRMYGWISIEYTKTTD